MKRIFVSLIAVSILAACSSTKMSGSIDSGPVTAINAQKLETTFKRKEIGRAHV